MIKKELKPLSFGEVFDTAIRLSMDNIKNHLPLYLLIYLANTIMGLLSYLIISRLTGQPIIDIITGEALRHLSSGELFRYSFTSYGVSILTSLPLVYTQSLAIDLAIKNCFGKSWSLGESARRIGGKFFILMGAASLAILISLAGLVAFCIGALFTSVLVSLYVPAVINEDRGVIESIKRSIKLVNYSFFFIFGALILGTLAIGSLSVVSELVIIPALLTSTIGQGGYKTLLETLLAGGSSLHHFTVLLALGAIILIIQAAASVVVTAFYTSLNAVLFFNQKVKFEHYGMERMVETIIIDESIDREDSNQ